MYAGRREKHLGQTSEEQCQHLRGGPWKKRHLEGIAREVREKKSEKCSFIETGGKKRKSVASSIIYPRL